MSCSPNKKRRIWLRDNYKCNYCGRDLKSEYEQNYPYSGCEITVDHVIALVDGGTHDESNLVTACKECNVKRSVKSQPLIRNYVRHR